MLFMDRIVKGYTSKGLIWGTYFNLERDNEINPVAGSFSNGKRKRRQTEDPKYDQIGISHHHNTWTRN